MSTALQYQRSQNLQEKLRDKLQGAEYIEQLAVISEDYINILQNMRTKSGRDKLEREDREWFKVRLQALKQASDHYMRLLAKVLPDLKSIELSGDIGVHQTPSLNLVMMDGSKIDVNDFFADTKAIEDTEYTELDS